MFFYFLFNAYWEPRVVPARAHEAAKTCHDGFTMNDLVSYNQKHNEANGENNRDGGDE